MRRRLSKTVTDTHVVLCLLVGAGIDQQPHAVRVTICSGKNQRGPTFLRIVFVTDNAAPPPTPWRKIEDLENGVKEKDESKNEATERKISNKKPIQTVRRRKPKRLSNKASTDWTHVVLCLLVGAGIDQQSRTVRLVIVSGTNQCRPSILRVEFAERT